MATLDKLTYFSKFSLSADFINSLILSGNISAAAEFPVQANVHPRYVYYVTAAVTDNNPAKTNTGQSFVSGDWIMWTGNAWELLGNDIVAFSGMVWMEKSANCPVNNGEGILADTTGGSFTVTLPATPDVGDTVGIADAAAGFDANYLIIDPNGSLIHGQAQNMECNVKDVSFNLIYTGAATGWKIETYLAQGFDEVQVGPTGATGPAGSSSEYFTGQLSYGLPAGGEVTLNVLQSTNSGGFSIETGNTVKALANHGICLVTYRLVCYDISGLDELYICNAEYNDGTGWYDIPMGLSTMQGKGLNPFTPDDAVDDYTEVTFLVTLNANYKVRIRLNSTNCYVETGYINILSTTGPYGATGLAGQTGTTGVTGIGMTGLHNVNASVWTKNSDESTAGKFDTDSTNPALVTTILLNDYDVYGNNLWGWLNTFDYSQDLGYLTITNTNDFSQYRIYKVNTHQEFSTYWAMNLTDIGGGTFTITNGVDYVIGFIPAGQRGKTGATGRTGMTGSTGMTGAGPTGMTGMTGVQGIQGEFGPTGPQGVQGEQGDPGPEGQTGMTGETGGTGSTGMTGAGETGATGSTGLTGATGATGGGITGVTGATGATGTGGLFWIEKDADYSANNGEGILADTKSYGSWILTLPSTPVISDIVGITDQQKSFATFPLTVEPGSENIHGVNGALICNVDDVAFNLIYTGPAQGWRIETYLSQGFDDIVAGPQGNTGTTGPTGSTGGTGQTGPAVTGGTGATGMTGSTGQTGIKGNTGPTGIQGPQGVQGIQGEKGNTGVTGATGQTGSGGTGITGETGGTGMTGQTGPTGNTGAGETGATGMTGEQGLQGNQGITGNTGSTGATGTNGTTGPTGQTGRTGSTGIQGDPGAQGNTGATGSGGTGATGQTGMTGQTGTDGNDGATGPTGAGATGATGKTGNTGVTGVAGTPGGYGQTGITGATGNTGNTGLTGNTGTTGAGQTGATGDQGMTGMTGMTGESGGTGGTGQTGGTGGSGQTGMSGGTGATGKTGATGMTGAGNTGITGMTGPTGPQGNQGAIGSQGNTGKTGMSGATGATGQTGSQGNTGVTGPTGAQGSQGTTGNTGPTGGQGIQGELGPQGETGQTGATGFGAIGPQGETGETGPAGPTGNSGNTGPTGDMGMTGVTGLQGGTGNTGWTGMTGDTYWEQISIGGVTALHPIQSDSVYLNKNDRVIFNQATEFIESAHNNQLDVNAYEQVNIIIGGGTDDFIFTGTEFSPGGSNDKNLGNSTSGGIWQNAYFSQNIYGYGLTASNCRIWLTDKYIGTNGPKFIMTKTRDNGPVLNGDYLGQIYFGGIYDAPNIYNLMEIGAVSTHDWSAVVYPGYGYIKTDGIERVTIDQDGTWEFNPSHSTGCYFKIKNSSGRDAFYVELHDGKIGIGNSAPKSNFDVTGSQGESVLYQSGASLTLAAIHRVVLFNGNGIHQLILTTDPTTIVNRHYIVYNVGSGSITITTSGSFKMNGSTANKTLSSGQSANIYATSELSIGYFVDIMSYVY